MRQEELAMKCHSEGEIQILVMQDCVVLYRTSTYGFKQFHSQLCGILLSHLAGGWVIEHNKYDNIDYRG